jgi:sugar/nucleoside kinase (ribokinase family)
MSLLVVGSTALDSLETPFGKAEKIIGGSGTYISMAASYFTRSTRLVGVVGYDFPKEEIKMLAGKGIDLEGLQVREDIKSFFWSGRYHNDMNTRDTLVTELNALGEFDPLIPAAYKNSEYLMLGNLAPAVQKQVIERLDKRPKLIAMDTMNFWMDIAMDDLKAVLKMIDVLIINDSEARQLSGEYSLVKAAATIRKMGPGTLIIKKGEHGALLFSQNEVFYAPALPLEEVFDPTGAGDTFAGGFIGFMARNKANDFESMKNGVIYGSAMASFCVEKFGPERLKNLSPEEIEKRVDLFQELVQFKKIQLDKV